MTHKVESCVSQLVLDEFAAAYSLAADELKLHHKLTDAHKIIMAYLCDLTFTQLQDGINCLTENDLLYVVS